MSGGQVIVPLRVGSDGDPTHRPTNPVYTKDGEGADTARRNYLEKLGSLWMKSRNEYYPGLTYVLERLPAGYEVWGRPRPKDGRMDWYLFGSPFHKKYDSPIRFFPHFKHIMDHRGSNAGCKCSSCKDPPMRRNSSGSSSRRGNTSGGRVARPSLPRSGPGASQGSSYSRPGSAFEAASRAQPQTQRTSTYPAMDTSRVDEEGTPDVYRHLINKLKKEGTLDEAITEPLSMDWRAEQECLPKLKEELKRGCKWHPRAGEIVLFVRDLPQNASIVRDPESGSFRLSEETSCTRLGHLKWKAGFVGQKAVEQTVLDDDDEATEQWTVAYSGVRVEPLPDPNSRDKTLSKQYKYVPLQQTRPFVFWREYLANIDEKDWHPTIKNALTAMSTVSLVDKNHIRGTWPRAEIFCSAIFIGPEMICAGDVVRMLPLKAGETCIKVLVVNSIRLKLDNLDLASDDDYDEGRPYNSMIHVLGKSYTIDQTLSSKEWLTMDDDPPAIVSGYGAIHPLQPPDKQMLVPFSRIFGRLYEIDSPFIQPLGDDQDLDPAAILDLGREGVLDGREYARQFDRRISSALGAKWYWGDTRSDALDLRTVNGLEVGKYQPELERNPVKLRQHIKVLEEAEKEAAEEQRRLGGKPGIPGGLDLRAFMAPSTAQFGSVQRDLPGRDGSIQSRKREATSASVLSWMEGMESGSTSVSSVANGQKRPMYPNYAEDEDIRKQARLLNYANEQVKQAARVEVKVHTQRRE